jgi:hypothetical protein
MRIDDGPTMATRTKRRTHPGIADALKPLDRSRLTHPEPFGSLAAAHPFKFNSVNHSIPQVLRIVFRHSILASIPASMLNRNSADSGIPNPIPLKSRML